MSKKKVETDIYKIINEYGAVLMKTHQFPIAFPESILPYSKSEIKIAILGALEEVDDDSTIEQLKIGYSSLADFVPEHEANMVNAWAEEIMSVSKMSNEDFKKYANNNPLKKSEEVKKIWDKINKHYGKLSEELNEFLRILNK